ncbi:hypothetical protein O0544_01995 [Edwardsiella anguillarum]|nr:hypothetical protein [Edwardsiella anguillarum]
MAIERVEQVGIGGQQRSQQGRRPLTLQGQAVGQDQPEHGFIIGIREPQQRFQQARRHGDG